eukprot:Mrub_08264.p1 GENE.Mrub_08264~~Mrub_08264.p1  ORF type:complete len:277 (+),score=50.66 Mrub_08264:113-832(+)
MENCHINKLKLFKNHQYLQHEISKLVSKLKDLESSTDPNSSFTKLSSSFNNPNSDKKYLSIDRINSRSDTSSNLFLEELKLQFRKSANDDDMSSTLRDEGGSCDAPYYKYRLNSSSSFSNKDSDRLGYHTDNEYTNRGIDGSGVNYKINGYHDNINDINLKNVGSNYINNIKMRYLNENDIINTSNSELLKVSKKTVVVEDESCSSISDICDNIEKIKKNTNDKNKNKLRNCCDFNLIK